MTAAPDPARAAADYWDRKENSRPRKAAFRDVRTNLKGMARGLERCMYCEDSAGTDIDHFEPKSRNPSRAFVWANYLLACSHCNSNEKRTQFPVDAAGKALLIDPCTEDPYAAFQFVPLTGHFVPQGPKAVETDRVFGLNRREILVRGRRNTWMKMIHLVRGYGGAANDAERARHLEVIREEPFQAVVHHFVRDALAGRDHVPEDVRETVAASRSVWEAL